MNRWLLAHKPPRIAMLLLLAAAVINWITPLHERHLITSAGTAVVLGFTGFAVMIRAWWQFRQHAVAICPTEKTSALITDGIYRYTRNPMYLGMLMMLVAVALWIGTPPFMLAAVTFFLIMDRLFCPYEEDKLQAAFSDAYRAYASRIRRWL